MIELRNLLWIIIGFLLLIYLGKVAWHLFIFVVGMAFYSALGIIVVLGIIAAWFMLKLFWRNP